MSDETKTQAGGSDTQVRSDQLDMLAVDAARVAAAAFAAAGWTWGSTEPRVPDGPELAIRVREMMNDLQPGYSRSSGRLTVWRGDDEDGAEQFNVTLDLGTAYGDDA